jgi:general secretion pathway protein D
MDGHRTGTAHFNRRGSGFFFNYPSAFFDFLVEKGEARVLTETRIKALNQVLASLNAGEEVLYYEVNPNSDEADREVDPKLASVDTGVGLSLVPTIGDETLNLDLSLEVTNLTGFDGEGRPALNTRIYEDSLALAMGEERIVGGLTRQRKIQTTRKVPILGSLPVVGFLFGGEITSQKKSIVVVALTPGMVSTVAPIATADAELAEEAGAEEVVVLPRAAFRREQTNKYVF